MAWTQEELDRVDQISSQMLPQQKTGRSKIYSNLSKITSKSVVEEKKPSKVKSFLTGAAKAIISPYTGAAKAITGISKSLTSDYRKGEFDETFEDRRSGKITGLEATARNVGDVAAGVTDYVGEQVFGAVKNVYGKLPDKAQLALKDTAEAFVKSPVGEFAVEKIQQGGEAWKEFEISHPRAAENIAAIASIADLALEFTGGTKVAKVGAEVGEKIVKEGVETATRVAAKGLDTLGDIGSEVKHIGTGMKKSIGEGIESLSKKLPKVGTLKKVDTIEDVADYVKPLRSKSESIRELARVGTGKANLKKKTFLKGTELGANTADFKRAKNVEKYLTKTGDYAEDIASLNQSIPKKAEALKKVLQANDRPFNKSQLTKILNDSIKDIGFVGDESKIYKKVIGEFTKIQKKYKNKTSELWEALKEFDKAVIRKYPNLYDPLKNAPIKDAVREVRRSVQNTIEKTLPSGGFKSEMKIMSDMFTTRDILSEKAFKELGKSTFDEITDFLPSAVTGKMRFLRK